MNNKILTNKEFLLLLLWIILVVITTLIEKTYKCTDDLVLNKLQVKEFKIQEIKKIETLRKMNELTAGKHSPPNMPSL